MTTALDVAKYFLFKASEDNDLLSNLKLQKLVYYAQGLFLAETGSPLFSEKVEAWTYGPVIPDLYHNYKNHGADAIPVDPIFKPNTITPEIRSFLDEIYTVFGQFSGPRLIEISHSDDCWSEDIVGNVITHEEMAKALKRYIKNGQE